MTFEIDPFLDTVRLTVTHDELEPDSDMLRGITFGWPAVLSSLKTLLETGKPIPSSTKRWEGPPEGGYDFANGRAAHLTSANLAPMEIVGPLGPASPLRVLEMLKSYCRTRTNKSASAHVRPISPSAFHVVSVTVLPTRMNDGPAPIDTKKFSDSGGR